jgi:hypothetical protein
VSVRFFLQGSEKSIESVGALLTYKSKHPLDSIRAGCSRSPALVDESVFHVSLFNVLCAKYRPPAPPPCYILFQSYTPLRYPAPPTYENHSPKREFTEPYSDASSSGKRGLVARAMNLQSAEVVREDALRSSGGVGLYYGQQRHFEDDSTILAPASAYNLRTTKEISCAR